MEDHKPLILFHDPHSVVLIPLSRQPLQLHSAASDPRRDGAPGWWTLPGPGAEQQTPLSEKLLLPQERHLYTVSHHHIKSCVNHAVIVKHVVQHSLPASNDSTYIGFHLRVLLIPTGINDVVFCSPPSQWPVSLERTIQTSRSRAPDLSFLPLPSLIFSVCPKQQFI